jgi:hypothetical protein
MPELYRDLVDRLGSEASPGDQRHCLKTFAALLELWARRPWLGVRAAPDPTETFDALHHLLFVRSTPDRDDSLIGLAGGVLDRDDRFLDHLYELENELRLRAEHELEIRTLAPS